MPDMLRPVLVCMSLFSGYMSLPPSLVSVGGAKAQPAFSGETGEAPHYCSTELGQFLTYAAEPQPLYRCTRFKDGRFANSFCNTKAMETTPISRALTPLIDSISCEVVDPNRGEQVLIEDGGGPDKAFVKHVMTLPVAEREKALTYIDAYRVRFFPHYGDYKTSAIQRLPSGQHMMGFTTEAPFWSAQELLLRLGQIDLLQRADLFLKKMGSHFSLRILGSDNKRAGEIIDFMESHQDEVAAILTRERIETIHLLDHYETPTHKVDCFTLALSDSVEQTIRFLATGEGQFDNRFPRSACGG